MPKDHRYDTIRPMYERGMITKLSDIFKYIPKTRVGKDAHMNTEQISARLKNPEKFMVRQLFRIGEACELTEGEMLELMLNEYRHQKAKKNPS